MSIKVKNLRKNYSKGVIDIKTFFFDLKKLFNKSKDKSQFTALEINNLYINDGDIIGIIGKNGAGKSTFCKLLSRVTTPSSGSIVLEGKVISMLEVNAGFHEQLTGLQNIYLRGSILGMTKKEINKNLNEIIEFSELREFINTPVKRYSTGMCVKLGFAIGLHLKNKILICDESLAVSDEKFKLKCINRLKNNYNDEKILIFVSHDLNLIKMLCKRILVFDNSKIIDDSTDVDTIVDKYKFLEN